MLSNSPLRQLLPKCQKTNNCSRTLHKEPIEVRLWENFLDEANDYPFDSQQKVKKIRFPEHNHAKIEEDVRSLFSVNFCEVTITNVGKKYKLNLLIETKRKHILDPIQDEEFYSEVNEEFCSEDKSVKNAIKQIYSYMIANERQYGVISTYNNGWFIRRLEAEPTVLYVPKPSQYGQDAHLL
ncbi:35537_t:CDS:2 [Gigaspora margarita]|uniref:35537_t:CDS:1 n=1 Tax=Gigaspora margarita TaxID=4874 RepID=A0ABM8W2Z7_GIGMA|nr:35537_t:CDS:2 [Gigaspora margarita]